MKKKKIQDFRRSINLKLNENLVGLNAGKMAYNFAFSGGSLRGECPFQVFFDRYFGSLGEFEQILNPDMVLAGGVCVYYEKTDENAGTRADKLVVVDKNNKVFYLNLYDAEPKFIDLNLKFTSKPTAFCYNHYGDDCLVFCSKTDNMVVWDGVNLPEVVVDAPKIISSVIHKERCFAIVENDPNTLWFSDDLDPTNWSVGLQDAGFIKMADGRGRLLRLISYGGYLYIFRERGISRLTANGSQEDFYLTHLFVSSGRILDDTITLCGDRIIFVATDGVYAFDGASTIRILETLGDLLVKNSGAVACFFNGKYYLTCKTDFFDTRYDDKNFYSNMLFAYDISSGEYEFFRGLNVYDLASVVGGEFNTLLIMTDENFYCYTETPNNFLAGFKSGLYNFDDSKRTKTVRKISGFVKNTDTIDIVLYNEKGEEKTYKFKTGTNEINVCFSGKAIGYKVFCKNSGELVDLMIE